MAKPTFDIIPCCSIHPDRINLYNEIVWTPYKPKRTNDNPHIPIPKSKIEHIINSDRTAHGRVSKIAKRKMTKALDYLLFITSEKKVHNTYSGRSFRFKIAFITLTLSAAQIHTDNEIKSKCLNQLLIELKKYHKVKHYVWRAEKQKNGNLHFHLIVNKFIPYQELRDRWNRILNKMGYIDRYRDEQKKWHQNGFKVRKNLLKTWSAKQQYKAYLRGSKQHWNSPNTTDIHSVQKIHNIKQYISKYLTKNEIEQKAKADQNIDIMQQQGRIWGCNTELSNIKGAQAILDSRLSEEIEIIKTVRESKVYSGDYYTVIFFDIRLLNQFPRLKLFKLFSQYLLDKFDKPIQTEAAA